MDIQAEKIELVKMLLETDNESLIEQVKAIFENEGVDFYSYLPQHVKENIDAGLKDMEEGNVFEHEQVMQDLKINMALKVKWTKEAKKTYQDIINYLSENWTDREVQSFLIRTNALINTISH